MEYKNQKPKIQPRLIIHGGAGNILPANLSPSQHAKFHSALLTILANTYEYQLRGHSALDTVTYAVTQLENNPLFNSGHGAVFTRDGINELECSIMVSRGKKKRGVGLMGLRHVKNPIKLAREMLIRGEDDLEGGNGEHRGPLAVRDTIGHTSSGAQGHDQMFGEGAERLAKEWNIELVDPSYFFVQNRWNEHVKGLEREKVGGLAGYCNMDYVPQGTCGAVALDEDGICAVATSTGGMTNKLTGRIGDTPTLGAGFWAEEWDSVAAKRVPAAPSSIFQAAIEAFAGDCISPDTAVSEHDEVAVVTTSTGLSGTGNGDSFLRLAAVRTASAISRYRGDTLRDAVAEITGVGGELQKSAGNRWKKTGEGEGGIIGIESTVSKTADGQLCDYSSSVVADYNCGGMFRALIDESGKAVCRVWREGQHDDGRKYHGEGKAYDWKDWLSEKPPVML